MSQQGALGPDLEGGELQAPLPRIGAITPGAPSVRVSAAKPSLLPVGIDSGGYDHRRNELASTVTARGIRAMEEEMRIWPSVDRPLWRRSKTYAGAFSGLPSYSTVTDLAKFRG
jgi:hypothetical protein